jgi:tRNA (guanine37-N1)-methyltransferase
MKFSVITAFPQLVQEALRWGVIGRALEKNLFALDLINPRDFTSDVHKTIDDRPFGGGDGMVMLYEPLAQALESKPEISTSRKIYLSPAGRKLSESVVNELAQESHLTLLCGRYGGVDQRLLNSYQFENISVGDYVVSGGELPALLLMDAVVRKQPGVLGNEASAKADSFAHGPFFEAPLFTRPAQNKAGAVPAILLSGDHKKIDEFRLWIGQALTLQARPEVAADIDIKQLVNYLKKIPHLELQTMGLGESFLKQLLGETVGKN